jgi:hypothetical protein
MSKGITPKREPKRKAQKTLTEKRAVKKAKKVERATTRLI